MITINLQDIKSKGSKALSDSEIMYLIVNSKMKSAIVPIKMYEMLMEALEELEDIKAIEERKNEESVSFEEAFSNVD